MARKVISLFLVAAVIVTMFPGAVLAEGEPESTFFNLCYNANGGEGTLPPVVTQYEGSTCTVSDGSGLECGELIFWKWNTQPDALGKDYFSGDEYIFDADTTLYAIYREPVHVSSVTISSKSERMLTGNTLILTAVVLPENTDYPEVAWISSDETVATVDQNGLVTALETGSAIISAVAEGIFDSCGVTVVDGQFTVVFNTQGGSDIPNVTVLEGGTITEPEDPLREGYTFDGWYKEQECVNLWVFDIDTVTSDITLYAKWTLDGCVFSGSGTLENPYRITNAEELAALASLVNEGNTLYYDKCYIQTQDIDLSEYENWVPIGIYISKPFSGIYDGNGNNISGLKISLMHTELGGIGLFGYITGSVNSLTVIDSIIEIRTDYNVFTGSIVGYIKDGTVKDCNASNANIIVNSNSTGNVGGLVGEAYNSSILDSTFSGSINGAGNKIRAGGITGTATEGTYITTCSNRGNVYSESIKYGGYAGGIVGWSNAPNNNCIIEKCFNIGTIKVQGVSGSFSGGITGFLSKTYIKDCYNIGEITTVSLNTGLGAGGIIGDGYLSNPVQDCYNVGIIAGYYCGGIVGRNGNPSDFISNCYYADTCESAVGNGTGTAYRKTLEELRQQSTYAGFDFDTVWTMDEAVETGYDYPQLKDNLLFTRKHELRLEADSEQGYVEGSGTYNFSESVTITAQAKEHYVFKNWAVSSGGAILSDATCPTATFMMPDEDVSIEAVFEKQKYMLAIESGGNGTVSGSGLYMWGVTVPVSAAASSGYQFMRWEIVSGQAEISDYTSMAATIIMPQSDVTIRAVFDVQPAGFIYSVADGKATITGYSGTGGAVTIPERLGGYWVKAIGDSAFTGKKSITSIAIPDSVETIGDFAFSECSSLTSISIGKGVADIGCMVFTNCILLTEIMVSEENLCYKSNEGVVYNKTGTELTCCPPGKSGTFSIPAGVETIREAAFDNCIFLSHIDIPDTVVNIKRFAFNYCTNLTDVHIPDSVVSIGDSAFQDCTKLQSISLPAGLSEISPYMFYHCSALKSVTIPNSVTSIGYSALYGCSMLESVIFSENLESISGTAFCECNLKTVSLPESLIMIGENAFSDNRELSEAYFSGAMPEFEANVFSCTASGFKIFYNVSETAGWALFSDYPKQAFCYATIYYQNGQPADTRIVFLDNYRAAQMAVPSWNDHTFEGWYKEEAYVTIWDFDRDMITDDIALYAKWRPGPYTVTVSSRNPSCGYVTGGGLYEPDQTAVLHAVPSEGCRFLRWLKDGKTVSTLRDYTFIVSGSCVYTAEFEEIAAPEKISTAYIGDSCIKLRWSYVSGAAGYQVWRSEDSEGPFTFIGNTPYTSYIDRGLAIDTTYYYMINAYCVYGGATAAGGQSDIVSQKTEILAPDIISADSTGYDSINIAWNGIQGADGYEIFRSTAKSGTYTFVYSTPMTNFTNRGLKTGTTYYYKVRAHDDSTGAYSGFSDIIFSIPVPKKVAGLNSSVCSVTKIKLSWGSVSGRSGYEIWRSTLPDSGYTLIKTTTGTYCYDTSVKPNIPYYYKVRAYRNVGTKRIPGVFSEVKSAGTVLLTVSSTTAVMYYPTSIKISWKAVPGRGGYEVERSLYPDSGFAVIKSTTSTYFNNTGLITNTRYYYRVRAYVVVNGAREYSGYSEVVSDVPALKKVTGVKTSVCSPVKVMISWNSAAGSSGYEILRSLEPDGVYEVIGWTSGTYYYNSGLEPNKTYYYKIRAYRTINLDRKRGCESDIVSASPAFGLASGAAAYAYSFSVNKITWRPVSGRSGYEIYRSETPEGGFAYIGSTVYTYYYDKNNISGKTYYYQVRAYVIVGDKRFYTDYSNMASVIRA